MTTQDGHTLRLARRGRREGGRRRRERAEEDPPGRLPRAAAADAPPAAALFRVRVRLPLPRRDALRQLRLRPRDPRLQAQHRVHGRRDRARRRAEAPAKGRCMTI